MATIITNAEDAFAVAMLAVMAASFSVLGLLWWTMRRRAARRDPEVDELLEEVAREEKEAAAPTVATPAAAQEWERDPDWWRR